MGVGFSANEWKMDAEEIFYQTDYYSGSDDDIAAVIKYSDDIDLTEKKMIRLTFSIRPSCSTNDLTIYLFSRHDENWTGNELAAKSTLTITNDGTVKDWPYIIPDTFGPGHYRWGMISGATTTFDIQIAGTKGRTWTVRRSE